MLVIEGLRFARYVRGDEPATVPQTASLRYGIKYLQAATPYRKLASALHDHAPQQMAAPPPALSLILRSLLRHRVI